MTEIQTRLIAEGGPAVLFENVVLADGMNSTMPVLVNLFGTTERVAWGMNRNSGELREIGEVLAALRQPEPPGGIKQAIELVPLLKTVMTMNPKEVSSGPCHEVVWKGDEIDLGKLPVQYKFHVAGALELFKDHLIHTRSCIDQGGREDR